METKNKKVQIEINIKDHDEVWLIGKSANFVFNPNTKNGEELSDFLSQCEEITDTSHQLEKLEAEKKELLGMLKSIKEDYYNGSINQFLINNIDEIESLIQKHKQ